MKSKRKNKYKLLIALQLIVSLVGFAQKSKPLFRYDLKYFFKESMTSRCGLTIRVLNSDIKKDSSFSYPLSEKKILIKFKFKNSKGACNFVLTDSLNNTVIFGSFANGLALLCDQNEAFTIYGTEIVLLRKYYEGIADGTWVYSDLKGTIQKQITYKMERRK